MSWKHANAKRSAAMTDEKYIERYKAQCKFTDVGCWEHQGRSNDWGYVQVFYRNKRWMVHRLMYTLHKGAIPAGMDCLHRCDNPPCCNPEHLWLGTQRENSLDMVSKGRTDAQKRTHCTRGHPYEGENLTRWGKSQWRNCKICARGRLRRKAGWPEELAFSMPPVSRGYRPVKGSFPRRKRASEVK